MKHVYVMERNGPQVVSGGVEERGRVSWSWN